MLKSTFKKLTYKTLFSYSLVVIALLLVAVPVVAANSSGVKLLNFPTSKTGETPQTGRSLNQGLNVDHLGPGQAQWYVYDRQKLSETQTWVSLALRYESEALIEGEPVNFQIFAQTPNETWFETPDDPHLVGTGTRSPLKTDNQNLVETFWSGQIDEAVYYVRVFNQSPFDLDYTLEAKEEQPAVSGAIPAAIGAAVGETESLNARQLAWTLTAQAVENMSADEAALWMQQAQAVGWLVTEGTATEATPRPDEANPQTLWRLTAQAIAGQDAETAGQWLIQADALGWLSIPLGNDQSLLPIDTAGQNGAEAVEAAVPAPPPVEERYSPINIYPNNPLEFNVHDLNSGRLPPYGEHWYSLKVANLDEHLIEDLKLTLFFTPRKGYISDRINFEIFPAGQYHIWQRGDADYMEHLGLGMWTSRDEDPDTGERIWNGSLVDNDRYFIKVKNGTPDEIDYYLFPDDVENAELGNPTLHKSDQATGYVPYALSPPTRPAE